MISIRQFRFLILIVDIGENEPESNVNKDGFPRKDSCQWNRLLRVFAWVVAAKFVGREFQSGENKDESFTTNNLSLMSIRFRNICNIHEMPSTVLIGP
jgi:hypothetical protein